MYLREYYGPGGTIVAPLCIQPHIRPTTQRLPYVDTWNATVQHQLTNTMTLEVTYLGNKGTHGFVGDGPTYNVNQPGFGAGTVGIGGALRAGCPSSGATSLLERV